MAGNVIAFSPPKKIVPPRSKGATVLPYTSPTRRVKTEALCIRFIEHCVRAGGGSVRMRQTELLEWWHDWLEYTSVRQEISPRSFLTMLTRIGVTGIVRKDRPTVFPATLS